MSLTPVHDEIPSTHMCVLLNMLITFGKSLLFLWLYLILLKYCRNFVTFLHNPFILNNKLTNGHYIFIFFHVFVFSRYLNGGISRNMEHLLLNKCHWIIYHPCLVEQKDNKMTTTTVTQTQTVTTQLIHNKINKHNSQCQVS